MATKKFKCNVCGYIHEGDAAPANCPVCGVPASEFTELKPEKKGLFSDKNGNAYIIMYSTVMVVIVATLLALAALGLQKRQYENELNEKKHAILASLSAGDRSYDEFIDAYVVDKDSRRVDGEDVFALLNDLPGTFEAGKFPIFEARDGRVVIPVTGMGLWGPVWGYVALEKDMNTVAGIIMAHKGETPGRDAQVPGQFRRQDDLRRRQVRFGDAPQGRRQGPRARGGCHFGRYEDLGRRDGDALQQPGELPAPAGGQAQRCGSRSGRSV